MCLLMEFCGELKALLYKKRQRLRKSFHYFWRQESFIKEHFCILEMEKAFNWRTIAFSIFLIAVTPTTLAKTLGKFAWEKRYHKSCSKIRFSQYLVIGLREMVSFLGQMSLGVDDTW